MIYINAIVTLQTLLFSLLLYKKGNSNILNRLLSILLAILASVLLGNVLVLSGSLPTSITAVFFLTQGLNLLVAPLVFYYLNLLSGIDTKPTNPLFFISSFFLIYVLYLGFEFLMLPSELQIEYANNLRSNAYPKDLKFFTFLYISLQHVYFSISWIRVYKFKILIKNVFSTRSRTKNQFAFKFISFVWVLDATLIFLYFLLPMHQVQYLILPTKTILAFSFILFFIFEQNAIFDEKSYSGYLKDIELLKKEKINIYDDMIESASEEEDFCNEFNSDYIIQVLEDKKLFLNPSITVFDLARELNCSHRTISSMINKELNQTFLGLINDMRIDEAKSILKNNPKNLTMEGVGLESGFNSRASFYRVFKNKTKLTPVEFMRKHVV